MEWRKRGETPINLSDITGCEEGEIEGKIIHGHQHSSDALNNSLMLVFLDRSSITVDLLVMNLAKSVEEGMVYVPS